MKCSRLAGLAATSAIAAQVVLAAYVLRFDLFEGLCLSPLFTPPVDILPVRVTVCPNGTSAQWTFDPNMPRIHPAANESLCLEIPMLSDDLRVGECSTDTNSNFTQGFSFDPDTKLISIPLQIVPTRFCITIGSTIAPCNVTDEDQLWVAADI